MVCVGLFRFIGYIVRGLLKPAWCDVKRAVVTASACRVFNEHRHIQRGDFRILCLVGVRQIAGVIAMALSRTYVYWRHARLGYASVYYDL